MALIKSANGSLSDVFIQWMNIHSLATNTERFAITFWKERNHQKVETSTNSEEKPQKVLIVESFEGDTEKTQ